MRTNKTLAQLDPAITISPTLLECRCNHQLLRVCLCVTTSACAICEDVCMHAYMDGTYCTAVGLSYYLSK